MRFNDESKLQVCLAEGEGELTDSKHPISEEYYLIKKDGIADYDNPLDLMGYAASEENEEDGIWEAVEQEAVILPDEATGPDSDIQVADPENTNVLKGFRCPNCGATDSFGIAMDVVFLVTDEGTQEQLSDHTWDNASYCECRTCSHHGTVATFTGETADEESKGTDPDGAGSPEDRTTD
jgi:hypothetical protein